MDRIDGVERFNEEPTLNPLLGLGLKPDLPDNDSERTLAVILNLIKKQSEETQKLSVELRAELRTEIQKLKDVNVKFLDRFDTQNIINQEVLRRLSAIEDGELDIVPLSSTNIRDLIEYKGLDENMTNALIYLEKKKTLYVRDLKRLNIMFKFSRQYIRYLHKIGKISGYPVKQTKHGLWYVEKTEIPEDDF